MKTMNGRRRAESLPRASAGAALLVMLLVVVLAVSAALIGSLAGNDPEIERQRRTFEALMQAKQALIAWAMVRGDHDSDSNHRPGTLPCPDIQFFGSAESGNASGSCSASGGTSIGRIPWRSLGVDNAYGEMLWYVVGDGFRNPSQSKAAINSDIKGTLRLYASDGVILVTPAGEELAAVIFASGPPLPGQDRSNSSKVASEYLEAFNGKNNASAAGPFIMGPIRDSAGNWVVNDLVVGLTVRELVSGLEWRALNEAQSALKEYAEEHAGHYPNPAPFDASDCTSTITDVTKSVTSCASGEAICYGRLPEDALSPYVASWFLQNGWGRVMIYAINDAGCASTLNVDGEPKKYVLLASGAARAGQSRPSTKLSDYLEDAANADAWLGDPDFSVPSANSNDQLRAVP
ncbi:MAG: hypothetical protein LBC91_01480 [Candidatus Accumulibacter sp.]|jgi:hypothetical protein|nr:hypothetical protein [Accumulibacter sp.]